jgi:hypothetical protein
MAAEKGFDLFQPGGSAASQRSSTSGGFATMSQDTGDELNGRFTALQISNEGINNSMLLALGSLSSLCANTADSNILLSDMLLQTAISNGHLDDISRHTKVLLQFGAKLDSIDRGIKSL